MVDGNGVIRQHIIGEVNEVNWQERIEPCMNVLNELPAKASNGDIAQVMEACQ